MEIERVHGKWHDEDLQRWTHTVIDVPGDFAEIGVWQGDTFERLVRHARSQKRRAHAFDSFCGMNDPGPHDDQWYPKGKFDIGGVAKFYRLMEQKGIAADSYDVFQGYVPDCFKGVCNSQSYAFVIVDLDHYQPTVDALAFSWTRISPGGMLALDDFVPSHRHHATRAIKEFLRFQTDYDFADFYNQQLFLRKL
jgi:O-methyltransferase